MIAKTRPTPLEASYEGADPTMPIWMEVLILMLVAYAIGLGLGWALWGRDRSERNGNG